MSACTAGGLPAGAQSDPDPDGAPLDESQGSAEGGRRSTGAGADASWGVHEWGLIALAPGSARLVVAAGAPPLRPEVADMRDMAPAKPVIYVRVAEGAPAVELSVEVGIPGGAFLEVFPAPTATSQQTADGLTGDVIRWNARATAGGCSRTGPGAYPAPTDPLCARVPDGYCEASELSLYEAPSAACLQIGQDRFNHLFYRGHITATAGQTAGLGYVVRREGDVIVIDNRSVHDGIGDIVRVRRDGMGGMTAERTASPRAGAQARLPAPTQRDPQLGTALTDALLAYGLSTDEAAAFNRAWAATLTGPDLALPPGVPRPPPELAPAADSLWFFLPEAHVDALLPLTIIPAPAERKRVFVVYVPYP